jgi:hypothetical protein
VVDVADRADVEVCLVATKRLLAHCVPGSCCCVRA